MDVQQFDFTPDVQKSLGLPRGPFVLYSDYARLRAEVGRLEKGLTADALEETMRRRLLNDGTWYDPMFSATAKNAAQVCSRIAALAAKPASAMEERFRERGRG